MSERRSYTYRGETVERDYRGYHIATVLVNNGREPDHYRHLQADTRDGIRQLITSAKRGDRV